LCAHKGFSVIDIFPLIKDKKHVIWDWNGTLLNDLTTVVKALEKMAQNLKIEPIDKHTYLKHFRFPVQEFYKDIGFPTSDEEFAALSEDFHANYAEAFHTAELFSDAQNLLESVKKMGSKQSILTAAFQKHIDQWLLDFEIDHLFDHVYGLPDKLAKCKVDRGRELIELAQVDLDHTVLLGDTTHDLEVGKSLGIDVILLTNGHQHEDRLKKVHHAIFQRA